MMRLTRRGYVVLFAIAVLIGMFAQEIGLIGWWQ